MALEGHIIYVNTPPFMVVHGDGDMPSPHSLQVKRTYSQGTYRAGAMRQVSLVGAVDEEVGDYFPEFLSMLEESPFLEVSVLIVSVNTPTALGCMNVPLITLF